MNTLLVRCGATALLLGALTAVLVGCAVSGGGYGYAVAPDLDYYEPYGPEFGGWGPSYRVAPYRGGHYAAGRRMMPSLPRGGYAGGARGVGGGAQGGGGHGGGGHGGGGHGGGGRR